MISLIRPDHFERVLRTIQILAQAQGGERDGRLTLRSDTSRARIDWDPDVVRVYDSGGVLRLEVGKLEDPR